MSKEVNYEVCDRKEEIIQLYEQEKLSCRQIAEKVNSTRGTINYYLKRWKVEMRTHQDGIKTRYPEGRFGNDSARWKGGMTVGSVGGKYIMRQAPTHPYANTHGYVMDHRLVVEKTLGRYLDPKEIVHHINGDPRDNRPENLEVISRSQHVHNHFAKGKYVMGLEERIRVLESKNKVLENEIIVLKQKVKSLEEEREEVKTA